MHFDGRDADTLCREWHTNVLDDPDDVLPHQNAAIRWAQIGGLTAWLATVSAFWKPAHIYQHCLTFVFLTLPDLGNSPSTTPTPPFINPETMKKYDYELLSNYSIAQNLFI